MNNEIQEIDPEMDQENTYDVAQKQTNFVVLMQTVSSNSFHFDGGFLKEIIVSNDKVKIKCKTYSNQIYKMLIESSKSPKPMLLSISYETPTEENVKITHSFMEQCLVLKKIKIFPHDNFFLCKLVFKRQKVT